MHHSKVGVILGFQGSINISNSDNRIHISLIHVRRKHERSLRKKFIKHSYLKRKNTLCQWFFYELCKIKNIFINYSDVVCLFHCHPLMSVQ